MNTKEKNTEKQDLAATKSKNVHILHHIFELTLFQIIIHILLQIAENRKHYHYDPRLKFWMYIVAVPAFCFCLGVFIYRDLLKDHLNVSITEANKKRMLWLIGLLGIAYTVIMLPRLFSLFLLPVWWDRAIVAILGALPVQYFRRLYLFLFFLAGMIFETCKND